MKCRVEFPEGSECEFVVIRLSAFRTSYETSDDESMIKSESLVMATGADFCQIEGSKGFPNQMLGGG